MSAVDAQVVAQAITQLGRMMGADQVAAKANLAGGNTFTGDQEGKFLDRGGAVYNSALFASLDAMLAEIGASTATILLAPGDTKTLTGNLTIPANVTLRGDMGVIATNGHTLTVNGPISAGNWQVIDASGGGSVAFGSEVDTINARWLGVSPSVTATANTAALAMLSDGLSDGHTVFFPRGSYAVERPSTRDAILALADRTGIRIAGEPGAKIVGTHSFASDQNFIFAQMQGSESTFDGLDINISVSGAGTTWPLRAVAIESVASNNNPHRGLVVKNCRLRVNHPGGGDIQVDEDPNHASKITVVFVEADQDDAPAVGFDFTNNYVYDSPGRTVWCWNAEDILVEGNRFHNCADDYPILRMQVFDGRNIRIANNLLRKMSGQGPAIEFDGKWRREPRAVTITGNTLECRGLHPGINLVDIQHVTIIGNTIMNARGEDEVTNTSRVYAAIRVKNSQVSDPPANQKPTGNIVLGDNIIVNRPVGILVEAEGPTIVNGGSITDCAGHGIEVRGGMLIANGVNITDNGGDGIHFNQLPTDINGNDWTVEASINGCVIERNDGDGIGRTGNTGVVTTNGGIIRDNGGYGARPTLNWIFGAGSHVTDNTSGSLNGIPALTGDANRGLVLRKRQQTSTATTNQNNFDATDLEVLMFSGAANIDLTGIAGGSRARVLFIMCKAAAHSVTLKHADTNSDDGNRFALPGGSDYVLGPNEGVIAIYDDLDGNGAWKVFAT